MKAWILISLVAFAGARLPGQQFEAASVKVNKGGTGVSGGCHGIDSKYGPGEAASAAPLGRCRITAARLSHLIAIAYGIRTMDLISGGPEWIHGGFDRFDVEAKAEDAGHTTVAQLLAMLQALLVERFEMKFHRDTIERSGFALETGNNGFRMKPAKAEDTSTSFGDQEKPARNRPVALTARKYTMAMLATLLSQIGLAPVVDRTGLDGEYDFTLNWDEDQGPTLRTAIQEQLGLRLEPQKLPVSRFVIDSAQKPSAN